MRRSTQTTTTAAAAFTGDSSQRRRRPLLPILSLLVPALACLLPGCASGPDERRLSGVEPQTVSALEYGYVRPAADVETRGRGKRTAYYGNSDDLWDRVRRGPGLGIRHHARVDSAARRMSTNPSYLTDLNSRARPYLHLIIEELERARMPTALALLPEVESRYNPRAVSHKSASGMWQFMPYTGREMGLHQDGSYDGRNDVLAATRGAIRYLKQLHTEMGGDWALALASYNCGPGCVRRAIRANGTRDFWSLRTLPAETRNYVPKLLAVLSGGEPGALRHAHAEAAQHAGAGGGAGHPLRQPRRGRPPQRDLAASAAEPEPRSQARPHAGDGAAPRAGAGRQRP
jgi:membrane-bound lytic murein transglycosylase D